MYEALTNREIDGEIEYYDVSNVMTSEYYRNDASFLTEYGKLIILIEHQSTPNINMPVRQLLYYADIIKMYIADTGQLGKLYSNQKVQIPAPEFIVVYNGVWKLNSNSYSLDNIFEINNAGIKAECKIYNINYNELSETQRNRKDELVGYSFFVDRVMYYVKESHLELNKALKQAVMDCKSNNYLLEYIKRREFISMATVYFTSKDLQDIRYEDGIEVGREQGIEVGRREIISDMIKHGYKYDEISRITNYAIEDIKRIDIENSQSNSK